MYFLNPVVKLFSYFFILRYKNKESILRKYYHIFIYLLWFLFYFGMQIAVGLSLLDNELVITSGPEIN